MAIKKVSLRTKKTALAQTSQLQIKPQERLCFVVTKLRTHSWMEDYWANERKPEDDRVFH